MNNLNITIPEGTRDLLYAEAELYRQLTESFNNIYEQSGFSRIETPIIENYDLISSVNRSIVQEKLYKMTDNNGRLVVLRPDNTTPIARVAATKLRNAPLPQKLYYNQKIYRINSDYSGKRNEILQSGIEIIGATGLRADFLCIMTALETLKSLGLTYKLEIGHAGFFNALMDAYDFNDSESSEIKKYVESKHYSKFNGDTIKLDEKLAKLPLLFGGEEVFAEAAEIAAENQTALEYLNYTKSLYNLLINAGYSDCIIMDLGMVPKFDYYTGVMLRGYVDKAGEPVLKGGRYDSLLSKFDYAAPAIGFAINVCTAADAVIKDGRLPSLHGIDVIVHYDDSKIKDAISRKIWYNSQGLKCELSIFDTVEETYNYANNMNIPKVENLTAEGSAEND